jgi:hypothetical protein
MSYLGKPEWMTMLGTKGSMHDGCGDALGCALGGALGGAYAYAEIRLWEHLEWHLYFSLTTPGIIDLRSNDELSG